MDMDALLPASLAALRAGVSRQLFNYWRATGKIQPVTSHGGRALYRHGDVLTVERDTRRDPRSHRTAANA